MSLCSFTTGILCWLVDLALDHFFLALIGAISIWFLLPYIRKPNIRPRPAIDAGKAPVFSGRDIQCVNPANGEILSTQQSATLDEVNAVIGLAVEAQKTWAATTLDERAMILGDLLQYVLDHQEEICKLSVEDSGKTMMEAYYGEILTTCEKLRWIIANGASALQTEERNPPMLLFLKRARIDYHPLGVIGIIIPWNYPFHNVISGVAAALYAGNAAVVKVSEFATHSRIAYQEIFRQVLARRGYSPELVQLLPGYGDTGGALCRSPDISKILFIGSPQTGKLVMEAASTNLTPVCLELGGKDPFIVLPDAEFDHAVELALRGVFINQGQNCLAAERIYVHRSIYDKFSNAVIERVKNFRQGCPCTTMTGGKTVDCGAMTMPRQVDIVDELVQDAVAKGAVLATGGKRIGENGALFYAPTVLKNVTHNMRVVNEEAFGPVMLLIAFDSDEDVIQKANATHYGLGCSIFSTDYARAERIGKEIVSGMCTINDFGLSYLIQAVPFGGCKISGFGRFNGVEGLREFSRQRTVVTDRFPFRTQPPRFTKYPVPDEGPAIVHNAMIAVYGSAVGARLTAAVQLVKLLISSSK